MFSVHACALLFTCGQGVHLTGIIQNLHLLDFFGMTWAHTLFVVLLITWGK